MRLNGNLVLNAGGLSQIENAVIERVSALPAFNSAEKGRFVFLTTDGKVYYNTGAAWSALATGGNAAALQNEVDALETALGALVTSAGGFDAAGVALGNVTSATSISDVIRQLDAALTAEANARVSAVNAEVTRATGAEQAIADDLADEVSRAQGAEQDLADDLATEVTRATGAESVLSGAIAAETTRAQGAESSLNTAISNEVTRATAAEGVIAGNLATETTRAQGAESTIAGNLLVETTRAQGVESTLSGAIATEQTRATQAEQDLSDALDDEIQAREDADLVHTNAIAERVKLAGDTMGGDLDFNAQFTVKGLRAPALAGDAATKAYVDATAAGLSWQAPVVGVGATNPATAAKGDRFVNTADGKIYTATAADTFDAGVAPADGWALFDQSSETGYVFSGTAWVQFTGTGQVGAGVGLKKTGNVLDINLGAGIAELPSDEVGIDVLSSGGLFLTVDGSTADTSTTAQLAVKLDGSTLTRTSAGVKVSDTTIQRISDTETAIVAEVSRATAAEGVIADNLQTEVTRAQGAEQVLNTAIGNETSRAISAESTLSNAIAAETTRASGAEGVIAGNLATEVTRATAAEGVIAGNLAAEVTRAQGAETAIADDLADEVSRATAAEQAITDKLGKLYFLYDGSDAASHTVTHNLGQKYCSVTVIDSATDEVIIPQSIVFGTANQLAVTLNAPLAIKVVVVGAAF